MIAATALLASKPVPLRLPECFKAPVHPAYGEVVCVEFPDKDRVRGSAQTALWSAKKLSGGSASSGVNRGSKRNRVAQ